MSCDPLDILRFAESMADAADEVKNRSSISRAYYAAYHVAKTYEQFLPNPRTIRGGTHKQLTDKFCDINSDSRLRSIGYILRDMCTHREAADYDLSEPITIYETNAQIESAKRVIKKLGEFSESLVKEQAVR